MAKVHHIFIIYDVLTNNFHTYQLFTSSSSYFLLIVFPILPPPFLPSPPRFLAVNDCLSYYLGHAVLLSSPRCLACFISLSCQLLCSVLLSSPRCLAGFVSLSCSMRHTVLVSQSPQTCKHFSPPLLSCPRLSTLKNMPFNIREHALLDARKAPSWCKKSLSSIRIHNPLKTCWLYSTFLPTFPS